MLLAQTPEALQSNTWVLAGGLITIVFVQIGKLLSDYRQDKSHRESTAANLQLQVEQRDVLRQIEKGQTAQNGKLATVVLVNEAYHREVLNSLNHTCRAQPTIVQQINQKPQEQ